MSENSQVTRLLARRFSQPGERGRIVFWRDDKKQYADVVETLVGERTTDEILREVELITPEIGDENDRRYIPFTVRYRMFHEQPNQKFLVYLTEPDLAVQDNWLLDLELAYGPTFTMDKLAVTLTETLPGSFRRHPKRVVGSDEACTEVLRQRRTRQALRKTS